jgi:hypothetical protein
MKVCAFEPPLGCQACSRAKLSTSSLPFDRAILVMSPLTVANYQLDGTVTIRLDGIVMRWRNRNLKRVICHWHAANTGLRFHFYRPHFF